jgi:DNA-binding transcriptional MocR family regulator
MINWESHYATRAVRMQASEIREILKLLDQPDIISFAGGIPDPKFFPTAEIAAVCQRILTDPTRASVALQYAVSEGYQPLREYLVKSMAEMGVACTPDNILITNGSQQALDFLGKLFISPGETILVTYPSYLGALQAFNAYEPEYARLPELGETYTGTAKPKFGYVTPEFQNPMGTTLTLAEREALLNLSDKLDMPLIEDHAYNKLRYDGVAVPPIMSLAIKREGSIDNTRILYLGTFSKSIVPALRIGWIVGAKEVIRKLVLIKQASDLHVSPFNQMIAHEIASTVMETHTAKTRAVYKERRDTMLAALTKYMPQGVSWTKPEGGMFVWMTLPERFDGAELLKQSIERARVAFVPGYAFFPDRSGRNTIRLNFSLNEPTQIEEGIKRLAWLIGN